MSLEDKLAENTAALTALNATMTQHNSLLAGLAEKQGAKATAAPAAEKATTAKAATKAVEKAAEKKPETPAVTHETVAARVGDYVGSSAKGSEEATNKKNAIKKLLAHFGAPKVAELAADKLVEFDGMLTQIINGEDPLGGEEDGDDIL